MKRILLLFCFSLSMIAGYSQESVISLSAGYLIDIDRSNSQTGPGNGWRVIGTYQETLKNEKWAIGISTGIMEDRYSIKGNPENLEYALQSAPIFASGKYFIGSKDWKGYVKGSAGLNLLLKDVLSNKAGWYAGVGVGVDYHISKKLLINTEYEFISWQNDFYGIRLLHSFNVGIGYKIK